MEQELAETRSLRACATAAERREVLARLFVKHSRRLLSSIRSRMDGSLARRLEATDVLQETFLEAMRRLEGHLLEPGVPVYTWLHFLAMQKVKQAYRRHVQAQVRDLRRETPLGEEGRGGAAELAVDPRLMGRSPSQILARKETRSRLEDALGRMHPLDSAIVRMRHFEGLSTAEIAGTLGLHEPAVRQRYGRALRRLQGLVEEDL